MIRTLRTGAAALAIALACSTAATAADRLAPTGRWSAYDRPAARTPPMGWNSWNAFTSDIDEDKVMGSAQALVDTGLAAKGYRYVNIDDGWWLKRRTSDGRMLIRAARFPSAATANGDTSFRPLTDRLHGMGLKAGIYSDIGRNSCGQVFTSTFPNQPEGSVAEREVGLYGHVDQDIALYFQEWGFDLIKVDGCGVRGLGPDDPKVKSGQYRALGPLVDVDSLGRTDIAAVRGLYEEVGKALDKHNPDGDFIYSLCLWGAADVRAWGKDVGAISRTSEDISPTWSRMLHNLDSVSRRPLYAHPGTWNDPDMLYVGKGDFDAQHIEAARSHFSLWAMVNAPLLIGYDLRTASPELLQILGAKPVIALNQDPGGNQAVLAFDSGDIAIFVKTLASGDKAVAILNRTSAPIQAILTAQHLKFLADADIDLTNLWTQEALKFRGERKFQLEPRQTLLFAAHGQRRLTDGMFLSELPGAVNPAVDGVVTPQADPLIHRALLPWRGSRGFGEPPRYGGWGGAQADRTPYDQELAVAGRRFDTGLGVLANSRLEVRNPGFKRFSADVGVDDSGEDADQVVTFLVYGDGKLLARSRPMKRGQPTQALAADIAGVGLVELVASTARGQRHPVPVTWGEAALKR
ncbi:NPCBM/NEW2 domain-containing protein [Caulobacter sp.]|uniref:NPCBM/NEW2 domain-containing protein n=1 Tax=Caulobacter sp. TaxID=78 RepID=UPI002B4A751F|nr:NPCBM/NEW2 domain-containing protein [Caulobacter sp.]HJV40394.1 NPCBM/NEW2 domain-containing protein [Caulobacter sp.]